MNIFVLMMAMLLGAQQGGVLANMRTGVITGQVRSPDGNPVAGIRVAAMEAPEMGTQDSAVSVLAGLTQTDAGGNYRLEDIPVGKYFVVAGSLDNLSYYPTSITLTSVTPVENVDFFLSDSYNGVLEVTVHHVGSATPVPDAVVSVQGVGINLVRSEVTNRIGMVSFSGLPYGDIVVSTPMISMASALSGVSGYSTQLPQRDLSLTVTINPDRPKWAVSLGLLFPGNIHGTVQNSDGSPAVDVAVTGVNFGFFNGRRILIPEASTRTGSKGEYDLPASPGTHLIRTTAIIEDASAISDATLAFSDSYYPATGDPGNAKPVLVGNGEQLRGIDIAMVRTYAVAGKILNGSADGAPPSFILRARSGMGEVVPSVRYSVSAGAGVFEIRGVPEGDWDLYSVFAVGDPPQYRSGKTGIEIRGKDVDGVMIALESLEVRGKVSGAGSGNVTVRLVPIDPTIGVLGDAVPGEQALTTNGTFAFSNVPPLRYRLEVYGLLPGWYVADTRLGGTSIFNDGIIEVGAAAPPPIEVVVSQGAGTIHGTVENIPPNTRLLNARVVLVPEEPRRRNVLLYRTSRILEDGTFVIFPDPAPGSYRLFAVSSLPAGHSEWNAEFLEKYADVSIPVTVSPNQTVQAKLEFTRAR